MPLLDFPAEILIRILCNLNSLEQLFLAVQTCRRLYSCYKRASEEIVTSILTRDWLLDYHFNIPLDSRHLFIFQFTELEFAIRKSFIRSKDARKMLEIIRESHPKYKQLLILLHNRLCLRVEDETLHQDIGETDRRWWSQDIFRRHRDWWDIDIDEESVLSTDHMVSEDEWKHIYTKPVEEFGDNLIIPDFFTRMLWKNMRKHGRIVGLVRTVIHKASFIKSVDLGPMDWVLKPTRRNHV